MSLINNDIDSIIISYIFGENERINYDALKKIFYTFGKSQFKQFIIDCQKYYFSVMFNKYLVNDIYSLLQKIILKKNPKNYPCYTKFHKQVGNELIEFESLNRKSRYIIHFLSFYHGYLFIPTEQVMYENYGNQYYNIHDDPLYKDKPLEYRFLKRKRIHNLKYYDLYEKGTNKYNTKYILKKDISIFKLGATNELRDIDCIKII
jgi:hypothetical protein